MLLSSRNMFCLDPAIYNEFFPRLLLLFGGVVPFSQTLTAPRELRTKSLSGVYRVSYASSVQTFDHKTSNSNPLNFTHAHIIVAPVVKSSGFGVRVSGHALRDLDAPAIRQVVRNAGRTEGVAAYRGQFRRRQHGGAPCTRHRCAISRPALVSWFCRWQRGTAPPS
jgi:hypothetical protein